MTTFPVFQTGLKRSANEEIINPRPTKTEKISETGKPFASPSVNSFVAGLPQRLQERSSSFAARRERVHAILMAQCHISFNFLPLLADKATKVSQPIAPPEAPASRKVLVRDAPTAHWVRRSERPQKMVNYDYSLSSESLYSMSPYKTVKKSSWRAPRASKTKPSHIVVLKCSKDKLKKLAGSFEDKRRAQNLVSSKPSRLVVLKLSKEKLKNLTRSLENRRRTQEAAHTLLDLSQPQNQEGTTDPGANDATDSDEHAPSAEANSTSQFTGPSQRTREQLDALLKPPANPKQFPLNLCSKHKIKLSHSSLSSKPKTGLAEKLVQEMQARHALEVKGWDDTDEELE